MVRNTSLFDILTALCHNRNRIFCGTAPRPNLSGVFLHFSVYGGGVFMVRQESKHHHRIFGGEDASALHRLHQLFGLDGRSFPPNALPRGSGGDPADPAGTWPLYRRFRRPWALRILTIFSFFSSTSALCLRNTANNASDSRKVLYSARLWGGKLPPHSFVHLHFTAGLLYYGQYHKSP